MLLASAVVAVLSIWLPASTHFDAFARPSKCQYHTWCKEMYRSLEQ